MEVPTNPKIAVVVPTIRPEKMEEFKKSWDKLFKKYEVTLITVWDGEFPLLSVTRYTEPYLPESPKAPAQDYLSRFKGFPRLPKGLLCRYTDACRNYGFAYCASLGFDYILTLDDDVAPSPFFADPIHRHLECLSKRVSLEWMDTACHINNAHLYLRGHPYRIREGSPVMLSHGVWYGVPDFDGKTQLELEAKDVFPSYLPYYSGPIPKGVYFPMCGMNVMIRKEALPYFYFAPMGPDSGFPDYHRFADIFLGISIKKEFDKRGWACFTGYATIEHTRASDAKKNAATEGKSIELGEHIWKDPPTTETFEQHQYIAQYDLLKSVWAEEIQALQGSPS